MKFGLQHPLVKSLAVLLPLGLGLIWWMAKDAPYTPSTFYYQYYRPFPIDSLETAARQEPDLIALQAPIIQAAQAHQYARYEDLAKQLEEIQKTVPDHPLVNFYLAQAYLNLRQKEKAVNSFQIAKLRGGDWVNIAGWYEALTYLQFNEADQAIFLLTQVKGRFGPRASALHNDLTQ